jgi:hypothetical protein
MTVLLPSEDPFASPPEVFPVMGEGDSLVGLVFASGESVRLDAAGDLRVHSQAPASGR